MSASESVATGEWPGAPVGQPPRAPGPAGAEELKEILQHQLDHLQVWQLELQQQLQLLHEHQPSPDSAQPGPQQPPPHQRQGPGRPPAAQPRRAAPQGQAPQWQQARCARPPGLPWQGSGSAPLGAAAAAPGGAAPAGVPPPPGPKRGRRPSAASSSAGVALAAADAAEGGGGGAASTSGGPGAPRKLQHQCVPKRVDLAEQFGGDHVEQGGVTTLMIRNIPNLYTRSMLMEELDSLDFRDKYDFVYLPIDKGTQWNVGYAFVNFADPESASRCMSVMTDYKFCRFDCGSSKAADKLAQISVAHIQGLERNLQFYSGCAVHSARVESHRPLALPGDNQEAAVTARRQRRRRARRHGPKGAPAGAGELPAPGAAGEPPAPGAAASTAAPGLEAPCSAEDAAAAA